MAFGFPVEAEKKNSHFIRNTTILEILSDFQAHHIYLMVDSCFSGSMILREASQASVDLLDMYPSRRVLTSGRREAVSDGRPGQHSPFAKCIISFLNNTTSNAINSLYLEHHVIQNVPRSATQHPEAAHIHGTGDQSGQFFFYPKRENIPATPPPPEPPNISTVATTPIVEQTPAESSKTPQKSTDKRKKKPLKKQETKPKNSHPSILNAWTELSEDTFQIVSQKAEFPHQITIQKLHEEFDRYSSKDHAIELGRLSPSSSAVEKEYVLNQSHEFQEELQAAQKKRKHLQKTHLTRYFYVKLPCKYFESRKAYKKWRLNTNFRAMNTSESLLDIDGPLKRGNALYYDVKKMNQAFFYSIDPTQGALFKGLSIKYYDVQDKRFSKGKSPVSLNLLTLAPLLPLLFILPYQWNYWETWNEHYIIGGLGMTILLIGLGMLAVLFLLISNKLHEHWLLRYLWIRVPLEKARYIEKHTEEVKGKDGRDITLIFLGKIRRNSLLDQITLRAEKMLILNPKEEVIFQVDLKDEKLKSSYARRHQTLEELPN